MTISAALGEALVFLEFFGVVVTLVIMSLLVLAQRNGRAYHLPKLRSASPRSRSSRRA